MDSDGFHQAFFFFGPPCPAALPFLFFNFCLKSFRWSRALAGGEIYVKGHRDLAAIGYASGGACIQEQKHYKKDGRQIEAASGLGGRAFRRFRPGRGPRGAHARGDRRRERGVERVGVAGGGEDLGAAIEERRRFEVPAEDQRAVVAARDLEHVAARRLEARDEARELLVLARAVAELALVAGAARVDLAVRRQRHAVLAAARDLGHALPRERLDEPEVGLVRVAALVVRKRLGVAEAELALEVPAADVAGAVGRQQCRVAPAGDDAPDAEPRDRLDAPRPRHEVRALAVPRDDVLVRVAELADAVVAPRVHVGPG